MFDVIKHGDKVIRYRSNVDLSQCSAGVCFRNNLLFFKLAISLKVKTTVSNKQLKSDG